jgi:uncharacterized protein (DUF2147 family)
MAARISERRRVLAALLAAAPAFGVAGPDPVGLWTTIDDATGEPRARVEIVERGGALSGRILELLNQPADDPDPHCDQCRGTRRGERITGMTILWDARRDGDRWTGGEILDPENGAVYRVTLTPSADGRQLEVRGYVGLPLFGRSQVWQRPR